METAEDVARRIIHCQEATNPLVADSINLKRSEQIRADMVRLNGLMPGDNDIEKQANAAEFLEKQRQKDAANMSDPNEQIKKWLS